MVVLEARRKVYQKEESLERSSDLQGRDRTGIPSVWKPGKQIDGYIQKCGSALLFFLSWKEAAAGRRQSLLPTLNMKAVLDLVGQDQWGKPMA